MTLAELRASLRALFAEMRATLDEVGDGSLTEEQQTQYDEKRAKVDTLKAKIAAHEALEAEERALADAEAAAVPVRQSRTAEPNAAPTPIEQRIEIPNGVRRVTRLQSFTGPDAERNAYGFGVWFAGIAGQSWAVQRCSEMGIRLERAQSEGVNADGGFLVPEQFLPDIIRLVDENGVARRSARVVPMTRDTVVQPRRTSGLTAYFPGEGTAGTESDANYDQIRLTARTAVILDRWSNELGQDSIISMGDELATECMLTFVLLEDNCMFIGDGTGSTYGGIVGLAANYASVHGVVATVGQSLAADNVLSGLTVAELHDCVGKVPLYAEANAKWYMSKWVWSEGFERLAMALGGNTGMNIAAGIPRSFMGYPVELVGVMPKTDTNSQVLAYFGDMRKAVSFGDRQQMTVAVSDSASDVFEKNQLMIRATERFDVNVHDIGDTTTAGPLISLIAAAS